MCRAILRLIYRLPSLSGVAPFPPRFSILRCGPENVGFCKGAKIEEVILFSKESTAAQQKGKSKKGKEEEEEGGMKVTKKFVSNSCTHEHTQ